MDRSQKEEWVASLRSVFEEASIVVVTHYSGMTVAEMNELRDKIRESGASFKVTKNRLTRRALEGTKYKDLDGMFTGPTAIAYSEDPVAPAKVVMDFAKSNKKLIVIGGAFGEQVLDVEGVKALAAMPSLDESRAKLVGLLSTPATRVAAVLQAPAGQVARVIGAYAEQDNAA